MIAIYGCRYDGRNATQLHGPRYDGDCHPDAMGGMDADMMAAMPPDSMGGMGADMMAPMPPDAMGGMDADMMGDL